MQVQLSFITFSLPPKLQKLDEKKHSTELNSRPSLPPTLSLPSPAHSFLTSPSPSFFTSPSSSLTFFLGGSDPDLDLDLEREDLEPDLERDDPERDEPEPEPEWERERERERERLDL